MNLFSTSLGEGDSAQLSSSFFAQLIPPKRSSFFGAKTIREWLTERDFYDTRDKKVIIIMLDEDMFARVGISPPVFLSSDQTNQVEKILTYV